MRQRLGLVVRGGTLVSGRGEVAADVGIAGGQVAAIAGPGQLVGDEVLEARGQYVLPGVIDGHVHFREPGLEYKEDFLSGSRAAVMGGVTTVLDMPNTLPTTSTPAAVAHKRAFAAYCDFGVFGLLADAALEPMAKAGAIGFKCFLGQSVGDIPAPDDGVLLDALRAAQALGRRVAFHAENDALVRHGAAQLRAAQRTDPLAHLESRPVVAEVEAIQRAALLAQVAGASIHILHLSSREGLETVQAWRARGVDITCEVTPHHCFLTSEDMARQGSIARINPPIREPGHGQALLEGLSSGAVNCIATDHAPHTPAEKLNADIWQAVSGFAGVETSLRLFLTHGVQQHKLSLQALVRAMCEEPARIWGLYPRKGTLRVGSDADLTVVDLDREDTIEAARLHGKNNLSPWEGQRTRGLAVATVLRGQVVMRAGELCGEPIGRPLP